MSTGGSAAWHEPVMPAQVEELLQPAPGRLLVDATIGLGGHAERFLRHGAGVLGIDRDPEALKVARRRLENWADRLHLVHGDFRRLAEFVHEAGLPSPDGVLLDLGVSSFQLSAPHRGFSFRHDGPLDMRMDPDSPVTAEQLVNTLPERQLADLLWELGEERFSRRIARRVDKERQHTPITSTKQLAALVARSYPPGRHRIHPATRTFQALRMAVNEEQEALREGLASAVRVLRPGGRLCVIAFHSLEDRVVKHSFQRWESEGRLDVLTRKPVRPLAQERQANPRARSAKLRGAEVREVASS